MKKKIAFSLIELLITLIIIAFVTAAFAPVFTKKTKTNMAAISKNEGAGAPGAKLFTVDNCTAISNDTTGGECSFTIPQGVHLINVVAVSGGSGGGGGGRGQEYSEYFNSNEGTLKYIPSTLTNFQAGRTVVKIVSMIGGGGGGGASYKGNVTNGIPCTVGGRFYPGGCSTYNFYSGGGGASGARITNCGSIPTKVNGYSLFAVTLTKGIGGNEGNATNKSGGIGTNSVLTLSYGDGSKSITLSVIGGLGSTGASSSGPGTGGIKYGVPGTAYSHVSKWFFGGNLPTSDINSAFTCESVEQESGANGESKNFQYLTGTTDSSDCINHSNGGGLDGTTYGKGGDGQGGCNAITSSYRIAGSGGEEGYLKINFYTKKLSRPGAGGIAGGLVHAKSIPVIPGDTCTVRVGKGGKGGVINQSGYLGGNSYLKCSGSNIEILPGYQTAHYTESGRTIGNRGFGEGEDLDRNGKNSLASSGYTSSGVKINGTTYIDEGSNIVKLVNPTDVATYEFAGTISNTAINPFRPQYFASHAVPMHYDYYIGYGANPPTGGSYSDTVTYPSETNSYAVEQGNYGVAGGGGHGGKYTISTDTPEAGAAGQNGYVYIWW